MSDFFDNFKNITVNGIDIKDISRLIRVENDIQPFIEEVEISEHQTLYDIAYEYYGDDKLVWLIHLVNPGLIWNIPKTTEQMNSFIRNEYLKTCCILNNDVTPTINGVPTTLKTYDSDWIEISFQKFDPLRNQLVFPTVVDNVRIVYDCDGTLFDLEENEIQINTNSGTVGFTEVEYSQAIHHYEYNEIQYTKSPFPDKNIPSVSWSEYEYNENDMKRNINIIRSSYKEKTLDIVYTFIQGLPDAQV